MGNCLSDRKLPPNQLSFDINEQKSLDKSFEYYFERNPETRRNQAFSARCFEDIFPENPQFALKLFDFLEIYQNSQKYIQKQALMDFRKFIPSLFLFILVEIIFKDLFTTSNPIYKNFEPFELFSLVSLENTKFLLLKHELRKYQVTYLQAINVIKDFVKIYQHGQTDPLTDETHIKAFVDSVFKNDLIIEYYTFMNQIKTQFKNANYYLKLYFQAKFMMKPFPNPLPQLSHPSYILNDELLFQMLLSSKNTILQHSYKLELVYSNIMNSKIDFEELASALTQSKLPTLVLIQHEDQYIAIQDRSTITQRNVFGAISNLRWFDTAQYCGTHNDIIFSIFPHYRVYFPKIKGEPNFCYLNNVANEDKQKGIGFGDRIWIDKDIVNNSYVKTEDDTYENGPLVQTHIKQLKINLIEVWDIIQPDKDEEQEEQDEYKVDLDDPLFANVEEYHAIEGKSNYYWFGGEEEKKEQEEKNDDENIESGADFYWIPEKPSTQNAQRSKGSSKRDSKIQEVLARYSGNKQDDFYNNQRRKKKDRNSDPTSDLQSYINQELKKIEEKKRKSEKPFEKKQKKELILDDDEEMFQKNERKPVEEVEGGQFEEENEKKENDNNEQEEEEEKEEQEKDEYEEEEEEEEKDPEDPKELDQEEQEPEVDEDEKKKRYLNLNRKQELIRKLRDRMLGKDEGVEKKKEEKRRRSSAKDKYLTDRTMRQYNLKRSQGEK